MKLIPLDAILAKIYKLKGKISDNSSYCNGWQHALRMLELSLDTLEVKEVDLDKEVIDWWNAHYSSKAYTFEGYTGHYIENSTLIDIAKHFFELGMQVSNKVQKGEKA